MAIIVDETAGTISFTDCTVTFPYGFNVSTGVGTIIITPSDGLASFPLAIQGNGGEPPKITWRVEPIEPGDPLPSPNPRVDETSPGGPGEAWEGTITIYVHKGEKGDTSEFNILAGGDIDGSAADGYVLAKKPGAAKVVFVPLPTGDVQSSAAIAATPFSAENPRLLTTVTLPPRPVPRKIIPAGMLMVSGSVDTRVDFVAYLGDPDAGGIEIGRGFGAAGAAPPPVAIAYGPPNTPIGADGAYAIVPADAPAVVYYRAEQVAPSSSGWETAAAPGGARASAAGIPV
ncbi:hypothetical protein [Mycolicibacterium palauense]|uniref:hypothetical protein n=1 Tax=Mycolicibacterium palauense TaxID=2034511 RepID=UPI000BFEFF44|nr:hypothetical protein [Mycolicibacterium palauense]